MIDCIIIAWIFSGFWTWKWFMNIHKSSSTDYTVLDFFLVIKSTLSKSLGDSWLCSCRMLWSGLWRVACGLYESKEFTWIVFTIILLPDSLEELLYKENIFSCILNVNILNHLLCIWNYNTINNTSEIPVFILYIKKIILAYLIYCII